MPGQAPGHGRDEDRPGRAVAARQLSPGGAEGPGAARHVGHTGHVFGVEMSLGMEMDGGFFFEFSFYVWIVLFFWEGIVKLIHEAQDVLDPP